MKKNIDDKVQIERLSAFSDNIIAFALTLLALNLVPKKRGMSGLLTLRLYSIHSLPLYYHLL